MSFLLDGKPTDDVCSLRLTPTRPVVEMVLLEPEEAVRRFAASMRWVLSIVGVILVGGAIALGVAVPPVDRVLVIPLSVVGLGAVAALTPYMYRLQIRRYREQLATMRYPGPPGTTLRCDDRGLTIASRLIPWSALSIETAYLLRAPGGRGGSGFLMIQRLLLATAGESIDLDLRIAANGLAFVNNTFRRLQAQELAALSAQQASGG